MTVIADAHLRPLTVNGQRVEAIEDDWLIEDEWWRVPIHRVYYQVVLSFGVRETIYHDVVANTWYQQQDPYPLADSLNPD